jgi:hypothetical protein
MPSIWLSVLTEKWLAIYTFKVKHYPHKMFSEGAWSYTRGKGIDAAQE